MTSSAPTPVRSRRTPIWVMAIIAAIAALSVLSTGSAAAAVSESSTGATLVPWIQSDQADYAPGATVTLTGGNWAPGESVHLFVDDTTNHTWNHSADAVADDSGSIQDVFNLPSTFVSNYDVTATGSSSGVATATFTDSNVTLHAATTTQGNTTVEFIKYTGSSNCTTGASLTQTATLNGGGSVNIAGGGLGNGDSLRIGPSTTPPLAVTPSNTSFAFDKWTTGTNTTDSNTTLASNCIAGTNGNLPDLWAHFKVSNQPPVIDTLTVTPSSPTTDQTLTANVTSHDPDAGDTTTTTYQWQKKVAGTFTNIAGATGSSLNLATSGNGDKGDQLQVIVTVTDSHSASTNQTSAAVTVANSAPVAGAVAISPTGPTTNQMLTATPSGFSDADGDSLTYSYQWQKKVGAGSFTDIAGATGSTLNLATAGNGDKGDQIRVVVSASDGTASSGSVNDTVTVVNTAPVMGVASITPASPNTNSVLTANGTATDADGDSLAYSYKWYKNGSSTPISGATGSTLDLGGVSDYGAKGDTFKVEITATDTSSASDSATSAAVTVVNTAPVMGVASITPASPNTNSVLTANGTATDADGDSLAYSYKWYKNGSSTPISGATGSTLDLGGVSDYGAKGDTFKVEITATDTSSASDSATSAAVTVVNTAPVMGVASITPASPNTNSVLTANGTATDADGDSLAYSYKWYKNGSSTPISGATGSTLDLGGVSDYGAKGDTFKVEITATDTSSASDSATSAAVTVVNTAPVMGVASITPASPNTNSVLTANGTATDADGDSLAYSYKWYKNGSSTPISGATGSTLDLGGVSDYGAKGDTFKVEITATDTSSASDSATSAAVTVVNTAPVMGVASITPASPNTNSVLTANGTATDADGDSLAYSYKWYKNGSSTPISGATGSTLDLGGVSDYGAKGDTFKVEITATDTSSASDSATSAAVTVVNTAPVMGVASITPASPNTNSVLTANGTATDADGDSLAYSYKWYKNGSSTPISGATGSTLDLGGVSDYGAKGDTFKVEITATDTSSASDSATSAAVTVVNTAPVMGVASITPASPNTNSVLTANGTATDADGDSLAYSYKWYKNGSSTPISGATGSTLDLGGVSDYGAKGDTFKVEITATDTSSASDSATSAAVTVVNTAPVMGVASITPASPNTNSVLTANGTATDADGDSLAYSYKWYKNGSSTPISGATGSTLDLGGVSDYGAKGDTFKVEITATDTSSASDSATSAAVTVVNTAPVMGVASITPASPNTNSVLTANGTATDADGDSLAYSYKWYKNGSSTPISGATGSTLDLGGVSDYGAKGDTFKVEITATDTSSASDSATSAAVTVVNTAPVMGVASITPASPNTNSVLTANGTATDADGDSLAYSYKWYKNGSSTPISGATGSTLDLGGVSDYGAKGDTFKVEITATDTSSASDSATSAAVTVVNTAPVMGVASITPASPNTNSVLTANGTATDADGDSLAYSYKWYKNGSSTPISGATGSTLDLGGVSDYGAKGDTFKVEITATDTSSASDSATSAAVTVVNTAPVMGVASITPASPNTNSVLTANGTATDADGDSLAYSYKWYKNGSSTPISGATGSTLDLGGVSDYGAKGDTFKVEITATDTSSASDSATSAAVTVVNTAPVMGVASITPASPNTNSVLTANGTATDADGDSLAYSYKWYKNGSSTPISGATGSTLDLGGVSDYGAKGDTFKVEITATDTSSASDSATSAAVTVVNTAPVMGVASITPASPNTNSVLTANGTATDADGDSLAYSYKWYKNGSSTPISGATGSTLDLGGVSDYGAKGDTFKVEITATDTSSASDSATSAAVTVVNTAPVMGVASITPASPNTNSVLTANGTATDADGDSLAYSYKWYKNGSSTPISGATGSTLDLGGVSDYGAKGDTFKVEITATDTSSASDSATSAAVTVVNTAPVMGVASITPASPNTNSVLTANGTATDADGDSLAYSYKWYKNGSSTPISGATGSTLDLGGVSDYGAKGDTFKVEITATDTSSASDSATSAAVTVVNTAPVMGVASITPASPNTNSVLTANGTATDADGDSLAYSYKWYKNGSSTPISGATGSTLDLGGVSDYGAKGDTFKVEITATDTSSASDSATSAAVTVVNTAPVMGVVSADNTTIAEGGSVSFSASASDADGEALTFSWNFGDGSTGSGASPSHVYADGPHTYTATVTVKDGSLATDSKTISILVNNVKPTIVSFTATDSFAGPLALTSSTFTTDFTDPGILDAWTNLLTYSPDGTQDTTTYSAPTFSVTGTGYRFTVTHSFSTPGCKSATSKVTDKDGGFDSASITAKVGAAAFQPPMSNQRMTDKLKNGQVLPVKVRFTDCNGNAVTLANAPAIRLNKGDLTTFADDTADLITIPTSTSAADTTGQMRYVGDGTYIYNMNISITLNTDYTVVIYPSGQTTGNAIIDQTQKLAHVIQATK